MLPALNVPGWKLCSHVIGRADEPRFGQGTAEYHQLSQTDGPSLFCYPSVHDPVSQGAKGE